MKPRTYTALAAGLAILSVLTLGTSRAQFDFKTWVLPDLLPSYGHRNWIVIADSAYPSQSRHGIKTVPTESEQLELVKNVLEEVGECKHVRPVVYLDKELAFVDDKDAPGIAEYRRKLDKLLGDRPRHTLLHEKIIDRLDRAAEKFDVLVFKSSLTLPYTSVFIELQCGYWSDAAEKRLREKMKATEKP